MQDGSENLRFEWEIFPAKGDSDLQSEEIKQLGSRQSAGDEQ